MMESNLYIYSRIKANGVKVVVDALEQACLRAGLSCQQVYSLDGISKKSLVVAYGVKENYELLQKGYRVDVALLVDAVSLGLKNKILFYLKNHHILNYDFFYSVYGWVKWVRRDKAILNAFKSVVLVSQTDIDYLKRLCPKATCKYLLVNNGANIPSVRYERTPSSHLRLGILASWGNPVTYEESAWFVDEYFQKYVKTHPNVTLTLAGRGPYIHRLEGRNNVKVLGEVPELKDFFSQIDIFLAVNPKGCGVLNRVLDAFAYQVPVVALPASMSGFQQIHPCFIPFVDYPSFIIAIEEAKNAEKTRLMVENAYNYIQQNHDWISNYDKLINEIGA